MPRQQQIVVSVTLWLLCSGLLYFWLFSARRSDGSFIKAGSSPRELIAGHWPLIAALAIMALLPAATIILKDSEPRFSVRTLFIATTLLAVVLGFGVWLAS